MRMIWIILCSTIRSLCCANTGCPFLKSSSFFHHYTDVLNHSAGEATARLIRFLQEETDYDMDLVWESILRTCSLSDVVRCAQLNRVLPSRQLTDGKPAGGAGWAWCTTPIMRTCLTRASPIS